MTKTRHDDDVAFIQALADLLRTNDLSELEVRREFGENDSLNVRVSRQSALPAPVQIQAPVQTIAQPAHQVPSAAQSVTATEPLGAAGGQDDLVNHPGAVTSPMVGTVYLQPEPGAESFIEPGKAVTKGQTLVIVEAMKTMNHISAPRDGVVSRVLVENGSPVEFGALLVILD